MPFHPHAVNTPSGKCAARVTQRSRWQWAWVGVPASARAGSKRTSGLWGSMSCTGLPSRHNITWESPSQATCSLRPRTTTANDVQPHDSPCETNKRGKRTATGEVCRLALGRGQHRAAMGKACLAAVQVAVGDGRGGGQTSPPRYYGREATGTYITIRLLEERLVGRQCPLHQGGGNLCPRNATCQRGLRGAGASKGPSAAGRGRRRGDQRKGHTSDSKASCCV